MSSKLSRRQVLAGLGTIGVASAGAGLGTTAFYSDRESLEGWLEAGRVDLVLDYRSTYVPWERYDLHDVAPEDRPPIVPGTDEMVYEIAAAPAVRNADGSPVDFETWGSLNTDVIDPCSLRDPTNLASEENDLDLGDFSVVGPEGNYLPGYVDGHEDAMFIDLVDLKPHDRGETTFSFHLCGNPSFISVELVEEMVDGRPTTGSEEDYREGIDEPTEPEVEAGEDPEDETFDGGELCDYLYVVVSPDPDCDNISNAELFTESDPDTEVAPVYAGSMSGWIEIIRNAPDGRLRLPPVTGSANDGDCFEPGVHCYVMEWYLPCIQTEPEDSPLYGFDDLPLVNNPLAEGSFTQELLARGYGDGDDGVLSANITQSDTCHVGMTFTAEQCRHNTEPQFEFEGCPDCEEGQFAVFQNGQQLGCIDAVQTDQTIAEFYGLQNFVATGDIESRLDSDVSKIMLVDAADGLAFVVVNDENNGTGGAASMEFVGFTPAQNLLVEDDDASTSDDYTVTGGVLEAADWQWANAKTDGMAVGPMPGSFSIAVTASFNGDADQPPLDPGVISKWVAHSDDGSEIELDMSGVDNTVVITTPDNCVDQIAF
ncbi:hypothetical protein [Haloarchaeobius amylolyticus]|uniref:hypothetical protein n=1 Tax=Haloarchaeobius amylolyticus TaxID=1198296 RepID=UPI002270A535|nr:hypothetical protein [Haloarchaeobius amylolyticus]